MSGSASRAGVNADVKVSCLVAGMAAGADSIDDMDVLRHGAMPVLFGGRAGTVHTGIIPAVVHLGKYPAAGGGPPPVPGGAGPLRAAAARQAMSWRSLISTPSKSGSMGMPSRARRSVTPRSSGKSLLVRGLNVLAATISTPLAAPVIAGARLRGGSASSARGAASLITEAVGTARAAGCTGTLVVRMDSAFYSCRPAVWAAREAGACFSVTCAAESHRSGRLSPRSRPPPGRLSAIPGPSGMTSWAAGSLTPRSPR